MDIKSFKLSLYPSHLSLYQIYTWKSIYFKEMLLGQESIKVC